MYTRGSRLPARAGSPGSAAGGASGGAAAATPPRRRAAGGAAAAAPPMSAAAPSPVPVSAPATIGGRKRLCDWSQSGSVRWEYEENKDWKAMPEEIVAKLEFAQANRWKKCVMTAGGRVYTVNLARLVQTSAGGHERQIRRLAPPEDTSATKGRPDLKVWQWHDAQHEAWLPYDQELNDLLNQAEAAGQQELRLNIGGQTYTISLRPPYRQTNDKSRFVRAVRPIIVADADAGGFATQWQFQDNTGGWQDLPGRICAQLDEQSVMGRRFTICVVGTTPWLLDLNKMQATDTITDESYALRQGTPAGAKVAVWQYKDEGGVWSNYAARSAAILENAHSTHETQVRLYEAARMYCVDFASMTQVNLDTNVTRAVRRAVLTAGETIVAKLQCDPSVVRAVDFNDATAVQTVTQWEVIPEGDARLTTGECAVCMMPFDDYDADDPPVRMGNCQGHFLHAACCVQAFKHKPECPTCRYQYASVIGTMPAGTLKITLFPAGSQPCSSYERFGTIVLNYHFPSGRQGPEHPHPGRPYSGTSRTGYLPDTPEGREVCELLAQAFMNRVTFTVGTSVTTGASDTTVWNGIHHKTATSGGSSAFGYPDADYFTRVKDELKQWGIVP